MKIKKFVINLLCAFIPVKTWRHRLRGRFGFSVKDPMIEIARAQYLAQTNSMAKLLHPAIFKKYKNKFAGKDVVLIATGPSLARFKPIKNAIYVGVNRAFEWRGAELDYLFMQDYTGLDYIEDAQKSPARKFYGILRNDLYPLTKRVRGFFIPDDIAKRHNATRYYVNVAHDPFINKELEFTRDISSHPLVCYGSVCFPAMQFILWTNPRRIYIVGVDLSHTGYFDGKGGINNSLGLDWNFRGWSNMKKFAQKHYPDTEIISVNPVGLRGLFRDLDQ